MGNLVIRSYIDLAETLISCRAYLETMDQWETFPEDLTDHYRKPILDKLCNKTMDWLELKQSDREAVFTIIDDALCYEDPLPILKELTKLGRIADLEWKVWIDD
jgi:hypothetical protein